MPPKKINTKATPSARKPPKSKPDKVEKDRVAALAHGGVSAQRKLDAAVLKAAKLGTFLLRVDENGEDCITSLYVPEQRKTDTSDWMWLVHSIKNHGMDQKNLLPITVALDPRNVTVRSLNQIKVKTKSKWTLVEHSELVNRTAKTSIAPAKDKRFRPAAEEDELHLDLKQAEIYYPPGAVANGVPDRGQAVHLLDGQKRIKAVRRVQSEVTDEFRHSYEFIRADVYDWELLCKYPNIIAELVNDPTPIQNASTPVDELKKLYYSFIQSLDRKFGRLDASIQEAKTAAQAQEMAGKRANHRHRGKAGVLDEIVLGSSRPLRVSTMSSLATLSAFLSFDASPVFTLGPKSHLPELAVFGQVLWAFQQRVLTSVLGVDPGGSLRLASVWELAIQEGITVLAQLAATPPKQVTREELVFVAQQALDSHFKFKAANVQKDLPIRAFAEAAAADEDMEDPWGTTLFGSVTHYILFRNQLLYAVYGPHTASYQPVLTSSSGSALAVPYADIPPVLLPSGSDARTLLTGTHQPADQFKYGRVSNEAFIAQHTGTAYPGVPDVATEARDGGYTQVASPKAVQTMLSRPGMSALVDDIFVVLGEISSMIDPGGTLNIEHKDHVIESMEARPAGLGPNLAADDKRDSFLKPLFVALLMTCARSAVHDVRRPDAHLGLENEKDADVDAARARASVVLAPLIRPMWNYIVENATVMASEIKDARRQTEIIAQHQKEKFFGDKVGPGPAKKDTNTTKAKGKGKGKAKAAAGSGDEYEDDDDDEDGEDAPSKLDRRKLLHRMGIEWQDRQTWVSTDHLHTTFWSYTTEAKLRTSGKTEEGATKRDVVRYGPGKSVIQKLIHWVFARAYTVHNSVHWCWIRCMLNSIEIACNAYHIDPVSPGEQTHYEETKVAGVPKTCLGWFGDYRTAVPMITEANNLRLNPPVTFRCRDRMLVAAAIPLVFPMRNVPWTMWGRVQEATVWRFWEPTASSLEEVQVRVRARTGSVPSGTIPILFDNGEGGISIFDGPKPRDGDDNEEDEGGPSSIRQDGSNLLHPLARAIPNRTEAWLKETRAALVAAGEEGVPADLSVPTNDLTGGKWLNEWHTKKGEAWYQWAGWITAAQAKEYALAKSSSSSQAQQQQQQQQQQTQGEPAAGSSQLRFSSATECPDPSMRKLVDALRIVPNEYPTLPQDGGKYTASAEFFSAFGPKRPFDRERRTGLPKLMMWEFGNLGSESHASDKWHSELLPPKGGLRGDNLFAPLTPTQLYASTLEILGGPPHSGFGLQTLRTLRSRTNPDASQAAALDEATSNLRVKLDAAYLTSLETKLVKFLANQQVRLTPQLEATLAAEAEAAKQKRQPTSTAPTLAADHTGRAPGTTTAAALLEKPKEPTPPSTLQKSLYPGSFSRESIQAAEYLRPRFMEMIRSNLVRERQAAEEAAKKAAADSQLLSCIDQLLGFYWPLFEPSSWMCGTGYGARPDAPRYGMGFQAPFNSYVPWKVMEGGLLSEPGGSLAGVALAPPPPRNTTTSTTAAASDAGGAGGAAAAAAEDPNKTRGEPPEELWTTDAALAGARKSFEDFLAQHPSNVAVAEGTSAVAPHLLRGFLYCASFALEPPNSVWSGQQLTGVNVYELGKRSLPQGLSEQRLLGIAPFPLVYAWGQRFGLWSWGTGAYDRPNPDALGKAEDACDLLYAPRIEKLSAASHGHIRLKNTKGSSPFGVKGFDVLKAMKVIEDLLDPEAKLVSEGTPTAGVPTVYGQHTDAWLYSTPAALRPLPTTFVADEAWRWMVRSYRLRRDAVLRKSGVSQPELRVAYVDGEDAGELSDRDHLPIANFELLDEAKVDGKVLEEKKRRENRAVAERRQQKETARDLERSREILERAIRGTKGSWKKRAIPDDEEEEEEEEEEEGEEEEEESEEEELRPLVVKKRVRKMHAELDNQITISEEERAKASDSDDSMEESSDDPDITRGRKMSSSKKSRSKAKATPASKKTTTTTKEGKKKASSPAKETSRKKKTQPSTEKVPRKGKGKRGVSSSSSSSSNHDSDESNRSDHDDDNSEKTTTEDEEESDDDESDSSVPQEIPPPKKQRSSSSSTSVPAKRKKAFHQRTSEDEEGLDNDEGASSSSAPVRKKQVKMAPLPRRRGKGSVRTPPSRRR